MQVKSWPLPSNIKIGMKQVGIKYFTRMNPQSSSLHRENGQFEGLLKHALMTAMH